jgi:pimeloyl-ACP methyl ester carboxylesterase
MELSAYSQAIATDDLVSVLRHLQISSAHIVGLSMGGFATLQLGLRDGRLARSLVVAGCGYGSMPAQRAKWQADSEALAQLFETEGAEIAAKHYAAGPYRRPFREKDPRGWEEFVRTMSEHSALGCALTQRGIQKARPSVLEWEAQLRTMTIPTLIVVGDSDDACLEPNIFLKRTIPSSQLCVFPNSGHQVNLEEPDLFNRVVDSFLAVVEARAID